MHVRPLDNGRMLIECRERLEQVPDMSTAVRIASQRFPHTHFVMIVAADSAYVDVAGRSQI